MRKILTVLMFIALQYSVSVAAQCSKDELDYFDEFLEDAYTKIKEETKEETKLEEAEGIKLEENSICLLELKEGMLIDIQRMKAEHKFKDQHCEYMADFCKSGDIDGKELIRAVLHPDCLMSYELYVDFSDCLKFGFLD